VRKRDRKELGRYVRCVADDMGLRDWTLKVDTTGKIKRSKKGADGEEWGATCAPIPGRKYATITFADDRRDDDLDDLRQTVVHELVHCHFYGLWDTLRRDTLDLIDSQQTYDTLIAGVERHMEYGVDAVAEAIAPRMPLIDWPS
jgi:hypothetical protein